MLLVWTRRQGIEHSKERALVTAIINEKEAPDAFKDYTNKKFPFQEATTSREHKEQMEILQEWTKQGPLSITAQKDLTPAKVKRRRRPAAELVQEREELRRTGRLIDLGTLGKKTPTKLRTTAGEKRGAPVRRNARQRTRPPSSATPSKQSPK